MPCAKACFIHFDAEISRADRFAGLRRNGRAAVNRPITGMNWRYGRQSLKIQTGHLEPKRPFRGCAGGCLISDVAWASHPSWRADTVRQVVLTAPFSGIRHEERVFLAHAWPIGMKWMAVR